MKVSTKDFTIFFGEGIAMGEVANNIGPVLVGHVRGRAYMAKRLNLWVREIWATPSKDCRRYKFFLGVGLHCISQRRNTLI